MADSDVVAALETMTANNPQVEALSLLNSGSTDAEIAQACRERAAVGQTVARRALKDAGEPYTP